MMAVRADGIVAGSVSGGCIEDDLVARVREQMPARPELLRYGGTRDEAQRLGLPCGGTVELACEPLTSTAQLSPLLDAIARGEVVERRVDLATGTATLAAAAPSACVRLDDGVLVTVHGPRWRLILVGAGELSRFLAQVAQAMDYRVLVCDPREEYGADWQLDGVELSREMPDDVVLAKRPDARTAVLALTHDPKLDDLALIEALRTPAFYVGALGSARNAARRRERLAQFDLSQAQLARLCAPVGLPIGSRTPAEIAIAILAHLTAVRNQVVFPLSS